MTDILVANDTNFDAMVSNHPTVIVDFWAPTCAPCRLMESSLERFAADNCERVKVLKVNVNDCPKTSARYMVRSLPTLLFFRDGQVRTQLVGAVNPKQIERTLHEVG